MDKKISYSFDNVHYHGTYDTEEEALAEALAENSILEKHDPGTVHDEVYIGDCEFFQPSLYGSGWDIIESIRYQVDDEGFGEYADEYLNIDDKAVIEELEIEIEKVFRDWIERHGLQPTFFKVSGYDIYKYDTEKRTFYKAETL